MHISAAGVEPDTWHVNGLPGSGSFILDTEMLQGPEVADLYETRYVPSPRSETLARTRVPWLAMRTATVKTSPPVT
jgi:hypothetical protein